MSVSVSHPVFTTEIALHRVAKNENTSMAMQVERNADDYLFTTLINYLSFIFSLLSFNSSSNQTRERLNSGKACAENQLSEVRCGLFKANTSLPLFLQSECY